MKSIKYFKTVLYKIQHATIINQLQQCLNINTNILDGVNISSTQTLIIILCYAKFVGVIINRHHSYAELY